MLSPEYVMRAESIPWLPHEGQMKALKFLIEHAAAGLFASPGTGKTSVAYAAFEFLRRKGIASKMLVIAPLRPAHLVWPAEKDKWIDFNHLRVEILHGPKKDEALARDADVYVINPDGLDWLLGAQKKITTTGRVAVYADMARFRKFGFDTLVIDELTMFKDTRSQRHKALRNVLDTFARRWGLTGSPAPNGLLDLFGQVFCLDRGRAFGPYVTHYRQKYFIPSFSGFGWTIRRGAEEEIYEKLRPLVLRLEAADYVDMPDLIENVIKFDLPPAARKIYDALEDNFIARIGDEVITVANSAVVTTKLRQIASGGIYLDPEVTTLFRNKSTYGGTFKTIRDWAWVHDEKTEMLADIVNELQGQPVLVAYDFQHDLERIQRKFGMDIPVIGGGTSSKRAAELERAWNAGELPILCGHPQSIGHGLNLQGAGNQIVWYTNTFNLELHQQFINRVQRQGSAHKTVFVHYLVARDTIDESILVALRNKTRVQDALLDALKDKLDRK
jgi:SNF2 family DNA or RNA helicase